jgi:hypothetical protein
MPTSSLAGYPNGFTIAALIYQVSLSSQPSPQTRPYALIYKIPLVASNCTNMRPDSLMFRFILVTIHPLKNKGIRARLRAWLANKGNLINKGGNGKAVRVALQLTSVNVFGVGTFFD